MGGPHAHWAESLLVVRTAVSVDHRSSDFRSWVVVLSRRSVIPKDLRRLCAGCGAVHDLPDQSHCFRRIPLVGAFLVRNSRSHGNRTHRRPDPLLDGGGEELPAAELVALRRVWRVLLQPVVVAGSRSGVTGCALGTVPHVGGGADSGLAREARCKGKTAGRTRTAGRTLPGCGAIAESQSGFLRLGAVFI